MRTSPIALELLTPAASDIEQEIISKQWLSECARTPESRRKYKAALALFLRVSGTESIQQACGDYENARRNIDRLHRELEPLAASSQRQAISALRTLLKLCEAENLYPRPVSQWLRRNIRASKCVACDGKGEAENHICFACKGSGIQAEVEPAMPHDVPDHATCLRCIDLEPDTARKLLLQVFYYTGARLEEVMKLEKKNIRKGKDESGAEVLIGFVAGKGRVLRRLVFAGAMKVRMESWLRSFAPDPVFVFKWRSPRMYFKICETAWARVGVTAENCGSVGRGPHLLRHCHVTNAKLAGASEQQIVDGTGHSKRVSKDWYVHVTPVTGGSFLGRDRRKPPNAILGRLCGQFAPIPWLLG